MFLNSKVFLLKYVQKVHVYRQFMSGVFTFLLCGQWEPIPQTEVFETNATESYQVSFVNLTTFQHLLAHISGKNRISKYVEWFTDISIFTCSKSEGI